MMILEVILIKLVKNIIIILLLMCLCGCNSDVVESEFVDVNNLEYYGYLVIPKVNMKLGFYNVDNEKNNVGENVTLIDTGINNTYLLAAHSGSGHLAYFNDLRYLFANLYANISLQSFLAILQKYSIPSKLT